MVSASAVPYNRPMRIPVNSLALTVLTSIAAGAEFHTLKPVVEVEEDVYRYQPANNGAGPMWCHGNTCLVRVGEAVFASCIETIPGARPLNNCLPLLFIRSEKGWKQLYKGNGRTREPCPLTVNRKGSVFLSINPTLTKPDVRAGPAKPQLLEFDSRSPHKGFVIHEPRWEGKPPFTEHSYRSFVADGKRGELILFQNIGYKHAEWTFRGSSGKWSAQGKLVWPWGAEYDRPQHIRTCYPAVALKKRAVHFCGVSDIIEPYDAWRAYKKKLTGRAWDYDFRRLFYTWNEDITTRPFSDWVEVASRDKTCGWISPCDMYLAPRGDVFLLWTERALDERLRKRFFPAEKQRYSLQYAIIRNGTVKLRQAIVEGGEGLGGERPGYGRFQVTPEGGLFVFYYVGGSDKTGTSLSEHRLVEILPDGRLGTPLRVKLRNPIPTFFTATVRAGCRPSTILDVYGSVGTTMRYARIRLW